MANDYGVFKTNPDGTESWLINETGFVFGDIEDAIDTYTMSEAITISGYLQSQSEVEVYSFGRPDDRHGK